MINDKAYQFVLGFLDVIRPVVSRTLLNREELGTMFAHYPLTNRANIGFDIFDNQLMNIKCYIGARTDLSAEFTESLCQKFIEDTNIEQQEIAQEVFDYRLFSLTENSFSLLTEEKISTPFARNVIAARLKGMQSTQVDCFVNNLSQLSNYADFRVNVEAITDAIYINSGTQRHPLYIFGVNRGQKSQIDEIKLYFDMYQFDRWDDIYAHNDYPVAIKTANALVAGMNDSRMEKIFPAITSLFDEVQGVLAIYGVNFRRNGHRINKFYFTDGNDPIADRRGFMSRLHEIIYGQRMQDCNLDLFDAAIACGFSPAEICIATDGKDAMMKVYFSTAY